MKPYPWSAEAAQERSHSLFHLEYSEYVILDRSWNNGKLQKKKKESLTFTDFLGKIGSDVFRPYCPCGDLHILLPFYLQHCTISHFFKNRDCISFWCPWHFCVFDKYHNAWNTPNAQWLLVAEEIHWKPTISWQSSS